MKSKLLDFIQDIVELYQYDGKTYAIPKDYDTIGLWYNKALFDEAGVSYPDESWTWETMAEAAEKLTDKDKGQYGFASPAANNQDGYYNLIYGMGGSIINTDSVKAKIRNVVNNKEDWRELHGKEGIWKTC